MTKKSEKPKARQKRLPGMEDPIDKGLADRGASYVLKRDKRIKASKDEKAAKDELIRYMLEKKIDTYRDLEADPPVIIVLATKHDVHVDEIDPERVDEPAGEGGAVLPN